MRSDVLLGHALYSFTPPLPRPVLQRHGKVGRFDVIIARQVRDGAGEFEDAVIRAGGELELLDGGFEQAVAHYAIAKRFSPEITHRLHQRSGIHVLLIDDVLS